MLVSSIDQEGGSFEIAKIFWGKAGTLFDVQPATMSIPESLVKKSEPVVRNGEVMASFPSALDFEFADFLSNSHTDVAVILESGFYSSWTLSIFDVQDRQTSIAYSDQPPAGQQFFIPWISSCDLKKDGDMDIIYEHFGQSFPYGIVNTNAQLDISRLDKLIWESDNGTFKRRLI